MKKINDDILFDTADLFKVFADSTRIRILYYLLENKEKSVSEISDNLNMNQSAISHQLKILKTNKLIKNRRDGKTIYYSIYDEHVREVFELGLEHINE